MIYRYEEDRYAQACLALAHQCKADVGFGAVLVKGNRILGRDRNRLSTQEERTALTHVDYAIHAEQGAYLDARSRGHNVDGATIHVIGMALRGPNKGRLTVRDEVTFICRKCPPSVLVPFNISVCIPHTNGWARLSPQEALESGQKLGHTGYWKNFVAVDSA